MRTELYKKLNTTDHERVEFTKNYARGLPLPPETFLSNFQVKFKMGSERIQKFWNAAKRRAKIFVLLGGSEAPLENFENQVSKIGGNWISDYLF